MNRLLGRIAPLTWLLWSFPVDARGPSDQPQVNISQYTVSGSHCRIGTEHADTSLLVLPSVPGGPKDYFQLTFDAFVLQPGEYGNAEDVQGLYGDCLVEMTVDVPAGYQISYLNYELDGEMEINQFADPKQVRGEESAEIATAFYLETIDRKWIADGRHSIVRRGNVAADVEAKDNIALDSQHCESKVILSVYTTATLESDTIIDSQSRVSVDRSSSNFGQALKIHLSKCPS